MSTISENERGFEHYLKNHPFCCSPCNDNSPDPGRALLSCGSGGIGPIPRISESAYHHYLDLYL